MYIYPIYFWRVGPQTGDYSTLLQITNLNIQRYRFDLLYLMNPILVQLCTLRLGESVYNGLIVGITVYTREWVVGWVSHIEGDVPLRYVLPTYTS
jgi:hypothetical protein